MFMYVYSGKRIFWNIFIVGQTSNKQLRPLIEYRMFYDGSFDYLDFIYTRHEHLFHQQLAIIDWPQLGRVNAYTCIIFIYIYWLFHSSKRILFF
jgi:hypothetical protein